MAAALRTSRFFAVEGKVGGVREPGGIEGQVLAGNDPPDACRFWLERPADELADLERAVGTAVGEIARPLAPDPNAEIDPASSDTAAVEPTGSPDFLSGSR